jgi:hypothetical protein
LDEQELTYTRFVLQNIAIVAVAYGIATALPVFSMLLGIFGAVTSTFIAYILPTFFYLRTSRKSFVNDRFSWVALTVLILGGSAGMVRLRTSHFPTSTTTTVELDYLPPPPPHTHTHSATSCLIQSCCLQASFGFIVEGAAKNGLG